MAESLSEERDNLHKMRPHLDIMVPPHPPLRNLSSRLVCGLILVGSSKRPLPPPHSPESSDRRPQQTNTFARFTQHEFSKAGNQSYAAAVVDHGLLYSSLGMKSPFESDAMKLCMMK